MRALPWIALCGLAFACSGSVFTSSTGGTSGGGGAGDTSSAGAHSGAGHHSGGSANVAGDASTAGADDAAGAGDAAGSSSGGKSGGAGAVNNGGSVAVGGSMPSGGSVSTGGITSSGGAGGSPNLDKACPVAQPTKDGACVSGLVCSYGDHILTSCRNLATCKGGKWSIDRPMCDAVPACSAPHMVGSACDPSVNTPCTIANGGVYCACTCSGPVCGMAQTWSCAGSQGGSTCSKLPPNEGQKCSGNASCPYGACSLNNSLDAICDGVSWSWAPTVCPQTPTM